MKDCLKFESMCFGNFWCDNWRRSRTRWQARDSYQKMLREWLKGGQSSIDLRHKSRRNVKCDPARSLESNWTKISPSTQCLADEWRGHRGDATARDHAHLRRAVHLSQWYPSLREVVQRSPTSMSIENRKDFLEIDVDRNEIYFLCEICLGRYPRTETRIVYTVSVRKLAKHRDVVRSGKPCSSHLGPVESPPLNFISHIYPL